MLPEPGHTKQYEVDSENDMIRIFEEDEMDNIKKNMHLALFLPSLRGGGAEQVMVNLARAFAERGLKVDMVLAKAEGPYLLQMPPEVRVVNLEAKRMLSSFLGLVRYLRREQPEVLISTMSHVNIVAVWARKWACVSTRVVLTEQANLSQATRNARNFRGRFLPLLMRFTYPLASGIVACSQGVADDLARTLGIQREHIQVIYNPIVDEELLVKAQEPVEHPWFQPGEPPVLLSAGRLTQQKDHFTLLRAFALVHAQISARLVLLGEGDERPALESLVRELNIDNDVIMPGFVDNPYKYIAQSRVFVLSSRWEGLPTVLVGAMACGTPVVSTNCPSGPSEIITNEVNGLLVPPAEPEALAEAVLRVLKDAKLASRLAKGGKERAKDFEVSKIVREYEKLFKLW